MVINIYVCLECESVFTEPKEFIETHGLDCPPYEHFEGCPSCGGAFKKTFRCDNCGEYITNEYIVLDVSPATVLCDKCYKVHKLEDD